MLRLAAVLLATAFAVPAAAQADPPAEFVSACCPGSLESGERRDGEFVEYRNTGPGAWAAMPLETTSPLITGILAPPAVAPGAIGRFGFSVQAPVVDAPTGLQATVSVGGVATTLDYFVWPPSPPVVEFHVQPVEIVRGQPLDVAVRATDDRRVDHVEFGVGGQSVRAISTALDVYRARLLTNSLAPGPQTLTATAVDHVGNVGTASVPFAVLASPREGFGGEAGPAPRDPNRATIAIRTAPVGTATRITRFDVRHLPIAATIELRCTGRGCPFKRPRFIPTREGRDSHLAPGFKRQRFPAGTVLEARVSGEYSTLKVFRFTMRAHRAPRRAQL